MTLPDHTTPSNTCGRLYCTQQHSIGLHIIMYPVGKPSPYYALPQGLRAVEVRQPEERQRQITSDGKLTEEWKETRCNWQDSAGRWRMWQVEQSASTKGTGKITTVGEVQSSFSRPLGKHGFWEGTERVNNAKEWQWRRYPARTSIAYIVNRLS